MARPEDEERQVIEDLYMFEQERVKQGIRRGSIGVLHVHSAGRDCDLTLLAFL